jgi:AcrR family transcriptional regulator
MPREKAYNREEVLDKAMNLFWENGYKTTSVRMLEKIMGINQFSIYSSFESKENLFIEALRKYREHVKVHVFYDLLKPKASLTDLELFFIRFMREIRNKQKMKGCLVVNTTSEIGLNNDQIARELKGYFCFVKDMLTVVLRNAVKTGELEENANIDRLANYLLGIMQGVSVASKVSTESEIGDFISVSLSAIR